MGRVKSDPRNMFPFFYLNFIWKSFDEFVPNAHVSKDNYYAIDRAGDMIIIDAS
jgi:hypothetical protein